MIKRYLEHIIRDGLQQGLVTIVYGARQTGKTTLAQYISTGFQRPLYLNCDEPAVRRQLTNVGSEKLRSIIGQSDFVVIDEAQRIDNIGITAKLIHDNKLTPNLLLTGSSSIDLANRIKEPLTGRAIEHILQPLSLTETGTDYFARDGQIDRHLRFGSYPGIWPLSQKVAAERLKTLAGDYLYKDAFNSQTIFDTTVMHRLLQLLALQVGCEVSYGSLANDLEIKKETVMRYIDLLEKAFIIYRVNQYRKNVRPEIGRLRKVYFYDLGIRNGLLENFNTLSIRGDKGGLWENFVLNERRKLNQAAGRRAHYYYWRSRRKQEIDIVEEVNGQLSALYECKYGGGDVKVHPEFVKLYGNVPLKVISRKTFVESMLSDTAANN